MKTFSKSMLTAVLVWICSLNIYAAEFSQVAIPPQVSQNNLLWEQAMQILEKAYQYYYDTYGLTFAELSGSYEDGICAIIVVSNGYLNDAGGELGEILILEDF